MSTAPGDGVPHSGDGRAGDGRTDAGRTDAGRADAGRRLVDEALRLVEAFREPGGPAWAAAEPGATEGDDAGGTSGQAGHAAHTGPECRVCPVCRVIAVVRTLRPEAVEHLAVAAAELASAWREVVAGGAVAEAAPAAPRREPSVERIDVTD